MADENDTDAAADTATQTPQEDLGMPTSAQIKAAGWIVGAYIGVLLLLIAGLAIANFEIGADGMLPAPSWDQITLLLASFGTLATGAAGVLLGTGVQQFNVHTAQREAIRADRLAEKTKADNERIRREVKKALDEAMQSQSGQNQSGSGQPAAKAAAKQSQADSMQRIQSSLAAALAE